MLVSFPLGAQTAPAPNALQPPALSPGEKAKAIFTQLGWREMGVRLAFTGIQHWRDSPEEWDQSWDGFGRRLGDRMGRLGIRYGVQLAADVALGTDPRYDRCGCTGGGSRAWHAVRRTFIARKDYGGETINLAQLSGAFIPPAVANPTWMPERLNTTGQTFQNAGTYLAFRAATNAFQEFWPEIKRKLPFGKR